MEKAQYLEFVLAEAEVIAEQFHFTERERQVLRIMIGNPDLDLRAVAVKLEIGVGTVRTHRRNIFIKTKTRSLDEFRMKIMEFIVTRILHRTENLQQVCERSEEIAWHTIFE